jgi:hypothetical protein
MKCMIIGRALSTVLIFGGMLQAANADTSVFPDTLRPNGHERGMALKRVDLRRCDASRGGYTLSDAKAETRM